MAVPDVPFPVRFPATPVSRSCTPAIDCIGYLVSRAFDGEVLASFERACHVRSATRILTLAQAGTGEGPATLTLRDDFRGDLRALVRRGDAASMRAGRLQVGCAAFDATRARVWQPPKPRSALAPDQRLRRLDQARQRLDAARRERPSVLCGGAASIVARMAAACRNRVPAEAGQAASMLIGLGEGLTPAGDDFLVGLVAALRSGTGDDSRSTALVAAITAPMVAAHERTTPFAAQALMFAARGHFDAIVARTLEALIAEVDDRAFVRALEESLTIGATSGADLVTGMLVGLRARDVETER